MFFQRRPQDKNEANISRVYIFRIVLDDGTVLHKIGKSSGTSSKVRLLSVLDSFFNAYRYIPRSSIRRDKRTLCPFALEGHMHKMLEEYSYKFDKKFSGSTEFFSDLDEEVLLEYFDEMDEEAVMDVTQDMLITEYEAIRDSKPQDSVPPKDDNLPPNF